MNNIIYGKLISNKEFSLANLKVAIYDVNMWEWQALSETFTDKDGKFELSWEHNQLTGLNKKTADIGVKVFTAVNDTELFSSNMEQVRFNAGPFEEITVVLTQEIPIETVEYDSLYTDIQFLAGKDVALKDLKETKNHQNVSFLSKELEVPKEKIVHFIVAQRLADVSNINADFFYALLRKNTLLKNDFSKSMSARLSIGLEVELLPLLYDAACVDDKKIQADVQAAVNENLVGESVAQNLINHLNALSKFKSAAQSYYSETHPEKAMNMVGAFIEKGNTEQVKDLFSGKDGAPESFLESMSSGEFLSSDHSAFAELYGMGAKVLPTIFAAKGVKTETDLKMLAGMNKSDWENELSKVSVGTSTEVISNFASTIVRKFEKMFPTQAFAAQLKRDKNEHFAEQNQVLAFFDQHQDFDLQQSQIDQFLNETNGVEKPSETVIKELKGLQRIFKLTPDYTKSVALLDKDLHSAYSIVALGEKQFVEGIAYEVGIEKQEALEIFEKAKNVHDATMMIVGEITDAQGGNALASIETGNAAERRERLLTDFPDLKTLFKNSDLCACEHCRSVYSPSAYFVELLEFLDNRRVLEGNAKDVLFERRADLGDIDLSCANSNVPVKYIDLVCEVLEEQIAPQQGIAHSGLLSTSENGFTGSVSPALKSSLKRAGFQISNEAQVYQTEVARGQNPRTLPYYLRDEKAVFKIVPEGSSYLIRQLRQTLSSEEELAAAPEYVNARAYGLLSTSEYAFGLPFDLAHVEAKAYFQRFGIERSDLMKTYKAHDGGVLANYSIAAEYFNLTAAELSLITTSSSSATRQNNFWNVPSGTSVLTYMGQVGQFLDKTGVSYEELETLLKLNFIKGTANLFIQHADLTCDTSQKTIANLTLTILNRMHRFLRLQKKLKWNFNLLDSFIWNPVIGNRNLDERCIWKLYELAQISKQTNISLEQLSACFGMIPLTNVDSKGKHKSLYHSIFLSSSKNGSINKLFAPEALLERGRTSDTSALLSHDEYIATCLHITKNEVNTLIGLLPESNRSINFQPLSFLYVCAQLCRSLNLKAEELLAFKRLGEQAVALDATPEHLLSFIETAKLLKENSWNVRDVQYVLRHEGDHLNTHSLSDTTIVSFLTGLRSNYLQINIQEATKYNRDLAFDDQKETLRRELLSLPGFNESKAHTIIQFFESDFSRIETPADRNYAGAVSFLSAHLPDGFNRDRILTAFTATAFNTSGTPATETQKKTLLERMLDFIASVQTHANKYTALVKELARLLTIEVARATLLLEQSKLGTTGSAATVKHVLLNAEIMTNAGAAISQHTFSDQFGALQLLRKISFVTKAMNMDAGHIQWYFEHQKADHLDTLEFNGLPYAMGIREETLAKFKHFVNIHSLQEKLGSAQHSNSANATFSFHGLVEKTWLTPAIGRNEFIAELSMLSGYSTAILTAIDQRLFVPLNLESYKNPDNYDRVLNAAEYARKMGVSVSQIVQYTKPRLELIDTRSLRSSLKALYDQQTWLTTLTEIMDAIRPQKRDALVSYLLARDVRFNTKNDLYEYFLIDVEMEACMPSSRIVQAQHSVQLFTQRCLLGFEPRAKANIEDDPNWSQWKWMKNYRVWEANRKVFLYPENWYDVSLTDDKSFLLDEFIKELQQNELSNETAEAALHNYLEKLDNIAFLEVMATWYDTVEKTMHVFARTKGGDPATYFYRRFESEKYWSPWEKVELDITGDYLLAFKRNGRLCLAWPLFTDEVDPEPRAVAPQINVQVTSTSNPTVTTPSGPPPLLPKPNKRLKIQLAISEQSVGKWKPKKVSKEGILTPSQFTPHLINKRGFMFFFEESANQVVLVDRSRQSRDENTSLITYREITLGAFNLSGCKGYPEVAHNPVAISLVNPNFQRAEYFEQRYTKVDYNINESLTVGNTYSFLSGIDAVTLLGRTPSLKDLPGKFRITYPHQRTVLDLIAATFEMFQLSLINRLIEEDSLTSTTTPFGTLLPYFHEDGYRAYTIVPGYYKQTHTETNTSISDANKRTASDVFTLLNRIIKAYARLSRDLVSGNPMGSSETFHRLIADPEFNKILTDLSEYESFDFIFDMLIDGPASSADDVILNRMKSKNGLVYGEQFKNFYHPLVCHMRSILYEQGIPALMKRETQLHVNTDFDFDYYYSPNAELVAKSMVKQSSGPPIVMYPIEDVDFTSDGSYSAYNWDLFYRVPLHIATSLTKNQRFEEALDWFHYIFDPMGASGETGVQRYWITKPFYQNQNADYLSQRIDNLLYNVSNPRHPQIKELEFAISEWRKKPFKPDVVARFRPVAYQKAVLMKYIDNLIEWGDHLFMQDTMESIAQATQLYVLADKLMGEKPKVISSPVKVPNETYNQLSAKIDAFGNALIHLENVLPDLSVLPQRGAEIAPVSKVLGTHYFCIPPNEKLNEYWDRIEDRLFKIRHCQNMDGVERSLSLFAPPIDPGMLVRANAAGLDIATVVAGINTPMPHYRFSILAQKATELAHEVRGLGHSLLQAIEKKDSEALTLLRNELEINVLNAVKDIKQLQIDEATEQISILTKSKRVTEERLNFYSTIEKVNANEQLNLDSLGTAHGFQLASQIVQASGVALALVPQSKIGVAGFGGSPSADLAFGGFNLTSAARSAADVLSIIGSIYANEANRASIAGAQDRRWDDWKFQERLASLELDSISKQIAAAEIRKEIAETDYRNHDLQIINAKKTDDFMRSKFTNKELYDWMIGQISAVYFKSYQLAHDFAKKAERCYRFELGNNDSYISYGYWNSMKKGLQSADNLIHDIKRMETGYLDKNKREYEITKHVSLAQLDPLALVKLRSTGVCDFEIPEVLYDMDHPGQYFRRLKSVSISLPCIAGPYTSVSAKLSLVNSRYRKNTNHSADYAEQSNNDDRFGYTIGAIQSIATSSAQNDSGVFELNFRDERYLPFENNGAISSWRLELPTEAKLFDHNTIADAVMHIKYTARDGGETLKKLANDSIKARLNTIKQAISNDEGLHYALNLTHDLPNEWHQLKSTRTVTMRIDKSRLPYLVQGMPVEIENVQFIGRTGDFRLDFRINVVRDTVTDTLNLTDQWNLKIGNQSDLRFGRDFTLSIPTDQDLSKLEELMLVVNYKIPPPPPPVR